MYEIMILLIYLGQMTNFYRGNEIFQASFPHQLKKLAPKSKNQPTHPPDNTLCCNTAANYSHNMNYHVISHSSTSIMWYNYLQRMEKYQ